VNPLLPAAVQSHLVLASASPRRAQILDMLGFEFEVVPTRVEEDATPGETPRQHALDLACAKAAAAAHQRHDAVCIGADTIVVLQDEVLEKPESPQDAWQMLRRLQGRWHTVVTAVALHHGASGRRCAGLEATEVHFRPLSDDVLHAYAHSGEPDDKAGGYAIQGLGAMLVQEVRGCFYNVMGFPIVRFVDLLQELHSDEGVRHG